MIARVLANAGGETGQGMKWHING